MFLFRFFRKIKVIRRINQILVVFFKTGFGFFIAKTKLGNYIHPFHRFTGTREKTASQELPRKFREAIEKLGPVFIKFGQILSTRWDILPKEYIAELEKLQSTVPPFSYREAEKIIEKNLGKPINKIFKKFDREPFASASLGQVYKATLPSGEIVAVKVQRPRAKAKITLDTEVLLVLAHFLEKHFPSLKSLNLPEVVQEFRRWTLNELDYRKEATNAEVFSKFFEHDPHVYGPKVYWQYTGSSILTLEYVEGVSLKDVLAGRARLKINKKLAARHIGNSFMEQFFEYGYFHADPHPGNIFIMKNNKIMFLDFGMVGFLDQRLTGLATAMILALIQKDVETLVTLTLQLEESYDEGVSRQSSKINTFRKELNQLVLQWSGSNQAGQFTRLFFDLLNTAVRNELDVPVDLIMLSKSILTLDTVMTELDPELNLVEWEKPLIEKIAKERFGPEKIKSRVQSTALVLDDVLKTLPESTSRIIHNLEKSRLGMEVSPVQLLEYERLLNANSKINTYGTLIAAVIIAWALASQTGGNPNFFLYLGLGFFVLFLISKKGS